MLKLNNLKPSSGTLFIICFSFGSGCALAMRPNAWIHPIFFLSILFSCISVLWLFIIGIIKWRERALRNLVSCILIVCTIPLAVLASMILRRQIFLYTMPRWQQAAEWAIANVEPNQPAVELPDEYADLAFWVYYSNREPCGVVVDFFWGRGYPVMPRHYYRRYAPNADWSKHGECWIGSWYRGASLSNSWYELSG